MALYTVSDTQKSQQPNNSHIVRYAQQLEAARDRGAFIDEQTRDWLLTNVAWWAFWLELRSLAAQTHDGIIDPATVKASRFLSARQRRYLLRQLEQRGVVTCANMLKTVTVL